MFDFFTFQVRPRIIFKAGAIDGLRAEIEQLRASRTVIITDQGTRDAGLIERVQAGMAGATTLAGVFSNVPQGASIAATEQAAAFAHSVEANLLIAVGGGSSLDTAKAMRILLAEGGTLRAHADNIRLNQPLIPLIAIPTTAGSGSEVSTWASVRDATARTKISLNHPAFAPDLALLDPELTYTMPPQLTAATGLEALAHAIEALAGINANPISDILALQAIDMISNNLRDATYDGGDIAARGAMLIAACIAGMAFSSSGGSGLGMIHALALAIGGTLDVQHSLVNTVLLPYGMQFNSVAVPNRFARIARYMGVNSGGRPEEDVIADGIDAVRLLAADCGLPSRLRDVGVPQAAIPSIVDTALTDSAWLNNPRTVTPEQLLEILYTAW